MEYTKQNFKSGQILTAEALNNMDSSLESAVNELNNKQEKITDGSIPLSALATEVKDKIENAGGGADWNAQQGEAGYIENKPFGIGEKLIPLDLIVKFSQLQKVSVDWAPNVFAVYLHPDPGYDSFISKDINPDADDILNIKEKGAGRVFGYSINNKMIYEEIDHNNFNQTLDGIDTQFDFMLGMKYSQDTIGDTGNYFVVYEGVMYVIHNITYNKIYNDESYMNVYHTEKIHENYLPYTVIKTTPQTLSDTDKNQALANLGIDNIINIDEFITESDENYNSNNNSGIVSKSTIKRVLGKYFYKDSIKLHGFPILYDNVSESMYIQVRSMNFDFDNNELYSLIAGYDGNEVTASVTVTIRKNTDNDYIFKYNVM